MTNSGSTANQMYRKQKMKERKKYLSVQNPSLVYFCVTIKGRKIRNEKYEFRNPTLINSTDCHDGRHP